MRIYEVGGAVRDELLGLDVQDRDFVVVGATPDAMVARGYKPVGKDFPVFLHPETKEEYALARTERKTSLGYKGFQVYASPEVTLDEDLKRRDLTINAMARDESGNLIDPFGGADDLRHGILRHVSPAFVEDPVRILRVARFAARFGFTVAPETMALMREMTDNGEVDALVPERVWQEIARGLMERRPSGMMKTLRACGALARILPELDALFGVPQPAASHPEVDTGVHVLLVVDRAATEEHPLPVRFAALMHDVGKGTTPREQWPTHTGHEERGVDLVAGVAQRLKVPNDCRDVALLTTRLHGRVHHALELDAPGLFELLVDADALRQPQRFRAVLAASQCDSRGRPGFENAAYPQRERLEAALQAALAIDAGAIARQCATPEEIRQRVGNARSEAIRERLALA